MADVKRPEIHLEVSCGFFRIPTETANFNITVLDRQEPTSATRIIEKIVEVERPAPPVAVAPSAPPTPIPAPVSPAPVATPAEPDPFYRDAILRYYDELCQARDQDAADNAPSDLAERAASLADMAAEARAALTSVRTQLGTAIPATEPAVPRGSGLSSGLESLGESLGRALELAQNQPPPPPTETTTPPPLPREKKTRYLFMLDTIFQTFYEFCTDEAVKTHIKSTRARAGEIFNVDAFRDSISPKTPGYPVDDGLCSVPMSDVFQALAASCSEKAVVNLLKNMDKKQSSIFLDQILPLEVPPVEEIEVESQADAAPAPAPEPPSATAGDPALPEILKNCLDSIDRLAYQASESPASPSLPGLDELVARVDDAITIIASIQHDVARLAGQTAPSGRGNRVAAVLAGLGRLLGAKERNAAIPMDEALFLARKETAAVLAAAPQALSPMATQDEVDLLEQQAESPPPPELDPLFQPAPPLDEAEPAPPPPAVASTPQPEEFGDASQADIDRLLAELG